MLYMLAAIGAICVAVLLWRAFVASPEQAGEPGERRIPRPGRPSRPSPIAPDDDPDFLRKLGERKPPPPEPDGN
ncbi:hypothetical protein [Actinophytocola xanthii]|uniref:Uncharacterized protein n=1 Tax=Actinophytocola xanthii TaxID=1912961 RepID=A0A1Q8CN55_9PSEU|nr:hypothetical protein [Actinophytocola xanthii]OLF15784.1 hypothetical protein BU204_20540 [Actinophytocola xanthii]